MKYFENKNKAVSLHPQLGNSDLLIVVKICS